MKHLIISFFLIISSLNLSGQNVDYHYANFSTIQLPSHPLPKSTKGYFFKVVTPYPADANDLIAQAKEKYQNALDNYPQKVEEAKRRYQADSANYYLELEIARENFRLETEAYNKLSLVERVALGDKKPSLKLPRKPFYVQPATPIYRQPSTYGKIMYNPEMLARTYLKLDGYKQVYTGDSVFVAVITLYDFESTQPERHEREKSYYDKESESTKKVMEPYYITSYKRPTHIQLFVDNEVIYDEMLASSKEFVRKEFKTRPNMREIEKKTVEESLRAVNHLLNERYGFVRKDMRLTIEYIKNKKGLYDDLENAKNEAVQGYQNLKNAELNTNIANAITIWKKALQESNIEDRKSRINKKVTICLLFNILKASIFTNQFTQAHQYVDKLNKMDLKYIQKRTLDWCLTQLNDRRIRFEASQQVLNK